MELNFGSTASENVTEIVRGEATAESGAGTITLGRACAKANGAKIARARMEATFNKRLRGMLIAKTFLVRTFGVQRQYLRTPGW